jgi:hypothetical protein|tara:strand:- start:376 stop:594 length:219 start_codon:yes stop_codon:yes gene_type:complete
MTLPREEVYAINRTREFLRSLIDPKKTPRIPKSIREEAIGCLRHYPWSSHEENILIGLTHANKLKGIISDGT